MWLSGVCFGIFQGSMVGQFSSVKSTTLQSIYYNNSVFDFSLPSGCQSNSSRAFNCILKLSSQLSAGINISLAHLHIESLEDINCHYGELALVVNKPVQSTVETFCSHNTLPTDYVIVNSPSLLAVYSYERLSKINGTIYIEAIHCTGIFLSHYFRIFNKVDQKDFIKYMLDMLRMSLPMSAKIKCVLFYRKCLTMYCVPSILLWVVSCHQFWEVKRVV